MSRVEREKDQILIQQHHPSLTLAHHTIHLPLRQIAQSHNPHHQRQTPNDLACPPSSDMALSAENPRTTHFTSGRRIGQTPNPAMGLFVGLHVQCDDVPPSYFSLQVQQWVCV